jgi:hypothetical protein
MRHHKRSATSIEFFTIKSIFKSYFTYNTAREATTHNTKITILYRTLQLGILFYIFGYVNICKFYFGC